MSKKESKVEKAVREAVVKTAKGIGKLEAKVIERSGPAKRQVKKTAKEIMRFATQKGAEAQIGAKKLSRNAVRTAKDAYKGFKEGIEEVRRKKKQ